MMPLLFVGFTQPTQAQTLNVKDVPTSEDTTISIQRGRPTTDKPRYEITEGTDELTGDPAPLLKQARANWKKACDEWKVELKELNKENRILTMNCGTPDCQTATMETTCRSKSKHKLRVQVE